MKSNIMFLTIIFFASYFSLSNGADCPTADLTGDCKVDFTDFATMAGQWLDEGTYTLYVNSSNISGVNINSNTGNEGITNYRQNVTAGEDVNLTAPVSFNDLHFTGWTGDINSPNQSISFSMDADKEFTANYELTTIVWVDINDSGVSGHEGFWGQMSKYETTNAQYCDYLNSAIASGDITVGGDYVIGADGSNIGADFVNHVYFSLVGDGFTKDGAINGGAVRINYHNGIFDVDPGFENHPVTMVGWYGATAFCNYYGYRLPTEWEWQAVADYDGSFIYGCGTTINNSIANHKGSIHPDGTTIVGIFGPYGYGICDMAGNVNEWTSSIAANGDGRIVKGGSWYYIDEYCLDVSRTWVGYLSAEYYFTGFRVCR
ncbi:MAG: SUMF1/EgtB/PvdO family nonheme iron enzyme [Phycisphaerales bacterium]